MSASNTASRLYVTASHSVNRCRLNYRTVSLAAWPLTVHMHSSLR